MSPLQRATESRKSIPRCGELELLLRELDDAQNTSAPDERRIAELQARIRKHRELHADCDYKPAIQ